MTTTATTTFDPSLVDIIEESFERCGVESRAGYDFRTARRSLNLLLLDWANRGINLWTLTSSTIAMVDGTATYNLEADVVDILDAVLRTGSGATQSDLTLARISSSTYAAIPAKTAEGRPIQYWVERRSGATYPSTGVAYPRITVYPVPDASSTYTFVYWYLRRIQEAGNAVNTQDIPFRFVPCLISGLAYYLAQKIPGAYERVPLLKNIYDEDWQRAADEDREKASVYLRPRIL